MFPVRGGNTTHHGSVQHQHHGARRRIIICLTAILACTGGQTVHAFYANAMPCRYVVHSRTRSLSVICHMSSYVICHHMSYVICHHMSYVICYKVRYILCFSIFVTVNTAHKKNVSSEVPSVDAGRTAIYCLRVDSYAPRAISMSRKFVDIARVLYKQWWEGSSWLGYSCFAL